MHEQATRQFPSKLPSCYRYILAQTILPYSNTSLTIQRRNARQPPHSNIQTIRSRGMWTANSPDGISSTHHSSQEATRPSKTYKFLPKRIRQVFERKGPNPVSKEVWLFRMQMTRIDEGRQGVNPQRNHRRHGRW